MATTNLALQTGKRKTAIARVYLRDGKSGISINGRTVEDYFHSKTLEDKVYSPLVVTDAMSRFEVIIKVSGGGVTGQAEACRHGIAKALTEYDPNNRTALRANGFLTRDSRMVERKKYGRRGARRRFQFSKR